jgi:acyl-homoserine lactone acylase PvdQ
MYNALTALFNHVTSADLLTDFKPDKLGSSAVGPFTTESVPHPGVTIRRDPYDVPQIIGKTRDDVTWGAGWVMAEDRGLLLQEARYDSLVAAVDAPGLSALNLISSLKTFKPSAQTEREVAKQIGLLRAAGADGRGVLHDLEVYLQGINAYIRDHDDSLGPYAHVAPFTLTDIYGFNALKDQFVGEGGGQQAVNSEFLSALRRHLGTSRGTKVWNDLREARDPETPASLPGRVALQPPPKSTSGNVVLDPGSLSAGAGQALEVQREFRVGRNQDSAWSLTSAGLDQIDTYVETLCGHSRHRYLYDGKCQKMQYFDAGTLDPGSKDARTVSFYRTVHGPVFGYARVHHRLVALSHKRASYGKDVLDLLFYRKLADDQVHNVHQFFRAADLTPQTFNSLYIDDKDIGMFTSGLVPIRPANVDPDLPINGTGHEEWRGYVPFKDHPQGINPPIGQIVSWNNRSEAGYEAPDDNPWLGAAQRVDLLLANLGHGSDLTATRVVSAMNEAATQDVPEVTVEPVLSKLLHGGRAPRARDAQLLALLDQWRRQGSSVLDRTGNGQVTAPGAAIMDTAWPLLTRAWASSVLGAKLTSELASFDPPFDGPLSGQSENGQEKSWIAYLNKDLRTIVGDPVRGKYAVRYCGAGNIRLCRRLMWGALDQAGRELAARQGPNPSDWHSSATAERISFVPGLLTSPGTSTPFTIAYTNRPSGIQQILSFSGHARADTGR